MSGEDLHSSTRTLVQEVAAVCKEIEREARSQEFRDAIRAARQRLEAPPSIALAGRVSAGKSTLLNALLGIAVAPTAAGECTRVVTRYRYGDFDDALVHLRDGRTVRLTLGPDRGLPEHLPVEWQEVEAVDVTLSSSPLAELTLIDTPGVSSLGDGSARVSNDPLGARSRTAARAADGLVYVITREIREDDAHVLNTFAGEAGVLRSSAANAILVINKVDKLAGPDGDPFGVAARLAARARDDLGPAVAAVVPVIGLLAETSACGSLTERLAQQIAAIASGAGDLGTRLRSARAFLAGDDPPLADRRELLRRLDLFGLRRCCEAVRDGRRGAVSLSQLCEELSGYRGLRDALRQRFGARASVLKAHAALVALRDLTATAGPEDRRALQRGLARIRDELAAGEEGQELRVTGVLHASVAEGLELPRARLDEVARWVGAHDAPGRVGLRTDAGAAQLGPAALSLASAWRAYGNDARRTPEQRHAAEVMAAAYARLAYGWSV